MPAQSLTDKYRDQLDGVLHCYDRVIVLGSLHPFCYAKGMTHYLFEQHIRIFDYAQFAQPLSDEIRKQAETLAAAAGLQIEYIRKKNFRKEAHIQTLLKRRGTHPGLVHIFSALESCTTYKPWHDKQTHHTYLRMDTGKCLHYYFYFIDPELGLCYLRVPTWCPFRLQFYFNAHAWLAHQLQQQHINFRQLDNAFGQIADYSRANELVAQFDLTHLHAKLDRFAQQYCPVVASLHLSYQWSLFQVEYATDLVFKRPSDLQAFYPLLVETLIHTVKPTDIATFLGQKLHGNFQGEVGTRWNVRREGTRLKQVWGPVTLKVYDKFGVILRIETTVNDVSFFQQYRQVQHRNGESESRYAPMKKTIYSLAPLAEQLQAANRRYLEFLSAIETPEVGVQKLQRLTEPCTENAHRYKGFNLLAEADAAILRLVLRGEFAINGLTARAVHTLWPDRTAGQISRLLKRLRVHGLLKKVGRHYKYYLTELGREIATVALKLRELYVIPALAH
ncbi:MAG: MarR family transcriptional regulator [Anaerolineae bacterium]